MKMKIETIHYKVKSQKSHKQKYEIGVIYLPKEWINKKVEIRIVK